MDFSFYFSDSRMDEQMEMDTEQAQLMLQLRQLHLKEGSAATSPTPSDMSSHSGNRGSNDSGFGSDKVSFICKH